LSFAEIFGSGKLESLGHRVALFTRDRQTDRHTTTAYTALAWRCAIKLANLSQFTERKNSWTACTVV